MTWMVHGAYKAKACFYSFTRGDKVRNVASDEQTYFSARLHLLSSEIFSSDKEVETYVSLSSRSIQGNGFNLSFLSHIYARSSSNRAGEVDACNLRGEFQAMNQIKLGSYLFRLHAISNSVFFASVVIWHKIDLLVVRSSCIMILVMYGNNFG